MDLHVTSSSSLSPPHPNPSPSSDPGSAIRVEFRDPTRALACPSCGHRFPIHHHRGGIQDLPGLPAGVKFDPTDQEIVEHLEAKIRVDPTQLHPLLDEFIPTLEGQNGICYTHPEKLPGVSKDGQIRHFFHRPSKAYTTGTRKRRKVHTDDDVGGGETRWHKTGKTRPVIINGSVKGFKKILVLYTNYSRQKKPEKTNWIMHQYHLGNNEEEKDGEIALSKVFYQTQPRQCGSVKELPHFNNRQQHQQQQQDRMHDPTARNASISRLDFYPNLNSSLIQYNIEEQQSTRTNEQLIPNLSLQGGGLPFVSLGSSSESRQTKE